jgi:hypothetical protein
MSLVPYRVSLIETSERRCSAGRGGDRPNEAADGANKSTRILATGRTHFCNEWLPNLAEDTKAIGGRFDPRTRFGRGREQRLHWQPIADRADTLGPQTAHPASDRPEPMR